MSGPPPVPESGAEVYRIGGQSMRGSGWHLGGGLVLTARHVVGGVDDRAGVRLDGDGQLRLGRVAWCGDDDVDVALVVLDDDTGLPRRGSRWGRLVTRRTGYQCDLTGVPAYLKAPKGRECVYDLDHVAVTINPKATPKSKRLSVDVLNRDPLLTAELKNRSPWAGMSGAAVVSGDGALIIGVVASDRRFMKNQLEAVPVTRCLADPEFRALVARHAGEPVVEPAELAGMFTAPRASALRSPAALLRADACAVAFHGREQELEELRAWLAEGDRFSARLLIGPGGQGKTRLASQLIAELRTPGTDGSSGWIAGIVDPKHADRYLDALEGLATPALLVVDYAEACPDLLDRLAVAAERSGAIVRMLLLARTAGEWNVDESYGDSRREWLREVRRLELGVLDAQPVAQRKAWEAAVDGLASRLPQVDGFGLVDWSRCKDLVHARPPSWLATDQMRSALSVQVDALVALLRACAPDGDADVDRGTWDGGNGTLDDASMAELLHHEAGYWRRTADSMGLGQSFMRGFMPEVLRIGVAAATLWPVARRSEAEGLLEKLKYFQDKDDATRCAVAEWLHRLYPADSGYWRGLLPDLLGEYHVARVAASAGRDLFGPPMMAASQPQREHALTVFARAAERHEGARAVLSDVVADGQPDLARDALTVAVRVERPVDLIDGVRRRLPCADVTELLQLVEALPRRTYCLRPLAVEITSALVDTRRDSDSDAELASALAANAYWLQAGGRHTEAMAAAVDAVELFEKLAAEDPEAHERELADALISLSALQIRLRYRREALTSVERAAQVHFDHYDGTDEQRHRRARALLQQAICLSELGRPAEAVENTTEAYRVYRALNGRDLQRQAGMADAKQRQAVHLLQAGKPEAAREAIEASIRIRRELVTHARDANLTSLAAALNSASTIYALCGKEQRGLDASEEAVEIYGRLVHGHVSGHRAELANALRLLSERRAALAAGRDDRYAAVALMERSVDLHRETIAEEPDADRTRLPQALNALSDLWSRLGEGEKALMPAEEAVRQCRQLVAQRREGYREDLADALTWRSQRYRALHRIVEAIADMRELTELAGEAVAEAKDHEARRTACKLATKAANAVDETAGPEKAAGSTVVDEAIAVACEALHLARILPETADERPTELLGVLRSRARLLARQGSDQAARDDLAEIVRTERRHNAYRKRAAALNELAEVQQRLGQLQDAVATQQELVSVHDQAERRSRAAVAGALQRLAEWQLRLSQRTAALRSVDKAVREWSAIPAPGASQHRMQLIKALELRAELHHIPTLTAKDLARVSELRCGDPTSAGKAGPAFLHAVLNEARAWGRAGRFRYALRPARVAVDGWQDRADQRGRPELPLAEALDVRAELLNRLRKPREARVDTRRAAEIRKLHADPAR